MSHPTRFTVDTISRRSLLRAGGLGFFGLNLANLLRARAGEPKRADAKIKSCILLFYYGGPSHLDTWDMKPSAPAEIRGSFRSMPTRVPGIRVCEHMPHCARAMDKLAVVRSFHHPMRNHNSAAVEALCGRTPLKGDLELLSDDPNSFPCYGSALSYLRPGRSDIPAHVALPHVMHNVVQLPGQVGGFLGAAVNAFQVNGDPNQDSFRAGELELPADMPLSRMEDRHSLLGHMETQTARVERWAQGQNMDLFQEKAFGLLHSKSVRRAFDLSQETAQARERYGRNTLGQSLLLARRLVEAGVRFVNVNDKIYNGQLANWDSHENNFNRLKNDLLPPADRGFAALVEDLHSRGLLDSTLVIALAEFGRTPRINKGAGRDHWPDCYSIVLAGGGIHGGSLYGTSDSQGAFPSSDAVTPGDLAATLFWRFGIAPETMLHDLTGRPYRLADGAPLFKLFT
jgi:hypothetical protein